VHRRIHRRLRVEVAIGILAAALAVLTSLSREWIEVLTGWDPDGGGGAVEWLIVVGLAVVAVAAGLLAALDRRRLVTA
jgi:hypothetical protein